MMQHKIYAYISDGAVEEEISQGVGRIAGNLGLNNLIMFYDSNDIQLSTECGVVMNEDTEMKYKSWGWNVIKINGNDVAQIREALDAAQKEQEINEEQAVMMNQLADAIDKFVKKFNETKKYALILTTQGEMLSAPVVTGDAALDITDEIIAGLNEEYVSNKSKESK